MCIFLKKNYFLSGNRKQRNALRAWANFYEEEINAEPDLESNKPYFSYFITIETLTETLNVL